MAKLSKTAHNAGGGSFTFVGGGAMKRGLALPVAIAVFAMGASLWAGSATWNFRSGIGTSPENPTLWTDPDNWQGGEPASGLTATATFPISIR